MVTLQYLPLSDYHCGWLASDDLAASLGPSAPPPRWRKTPARRANPIILADAIHVEAALHDQDFSEPLDSSEVLDHAREHPHLSPRGVIVLNAASRS